MQIDQEIERPEAMMEDSSNPNESDVDLPEEDPDVTDPDVTDPMRLEICSPEALVYRNRWSIAPRLQEWVAELADLPCSLDSQDIDPSITHLRGPARF